MSKAYLILADGTVFEGQSIGAEGKSIGEVVFTTGMTGYVETLTDPSYYGQIVTQTFPLIGNYGVETPDFESKKSWVRGYIVRELCEKPSNFRCEGDLSSFLKAQGIVGICGIDTRRLTKILREAGVMNGVIVSGEKNTSVIGKNKEPLLSEIRAYKIEDAVKSVQSPPRSSLRCSLPLPPLRERAPLQNTLFFSILVRRRTYRENWKNVAARLQSFRMIRRQKR